MRSITYLATGIIPFLGIAFVNAQPPQQRAGGRGNSQSMNQRANQARGAKGPNMAAFNQDQGAQNAMRQGGQQANQRPSADQLAQMLLANFDADGSGTLDQQELQSALMAMMQQMQQNRLQQAAGMNEQSQQSFMPNQSAQGRGQRNRIQPPNNNRRSSGRMSQR
ncbi:MAG: hypothetical protein Aurels2KO_38680 [Aureliella sp.]